MFLPTSYNKIIVSPSPISFFHFERFEDKKSTPLYLMTYLFDNDSSPSDHDNFDYASVTNPF